MKQPQISIIVPVYNAENTISRTLDSIYALSMSESKYEIIIVDDCSNDRTADIVLSYQKTHSNICLLKQPRNMRQGAARNRGIYEAKGDWILFVDADDCLESGICDIIESTVGSNSDICMFDCCVVNTAGERNIISLFEESSEVISGKNLLEKCTSDRINERGAPWGYLFRTSYIKNTGIMFRENRIYEDADIIFEWILKCERINVINKVGYSYIMTEGSSTLANKTPKTLSDAIYLEYRKFLLIAQYKDKCPLFYERMFRIIRHCVEENLSILIAKGDISYREFINNLDRDCVDVLLTIPYNKRKYRIILKNEMIAPFLIEVLHMYYIVRKYLK